MLRPLRALLVGDSEKDAQLVLRELQRGGFEVSAQRVDDYDGMSAALSDKPWDIVLSDYSMPRFTGLGALDLVKERQLDLPFIMVSSVADEDIAVKGLQAGARDFIAKGRLERLVPAIERELLGVTLRAEQKATEEQLRQSQKVDSIGRLAGGIAHDFNNLLTIILGELEIAVRETKRGRDPLPSIGRAMQAGDSAAGLTRQLLMFARKQVSRPEVLQVGSVVEQVQRMLARVIGEDIHLDICVAAEPQNVLMDRSQLEQVILNLAVNARDAMPNGGTLTIRTETLIPERAPVGTSGTPVTYVRLEVIDTGAGMKDEVLAHIFEPFFTTKAPGKGTGIGLATVHRVVEQAGGFIEAHCKVDAGSTFQVYLPSTDAPMPVAAASGVELPTGTESIMLVEDQPGVRALVEQQLSLLGYRVVACASAEEALLRRRSALSRVDLLVTDVVLSGINGPTLVDRLRVIRPELHHLYISGYTDDAVLTRGLATVNQLLHKPFSLQELARAVRSAIDRPN